jgi:hypothetical protein
MLMSPDVTISLGSAAGYAPSTGILDGNAAVDVRTAIGRKASPDRSCTIGNGSFGSDHLMPVGAALGS